MEQMMTKNSMKKICFQILISDYITFLYKNIHIITKFCIMYNKNSRNNITNYQRYLNRNYENFIIFFYTYILYMKASLSNNKIIY